VPKVPAEGEEAGEIVEPVKREYIDYDDPMTAKLREVKKQ
jgi:hypothetical protein